MSKPGIRRLIQEASITVVFTYALFLGGTWNGLVLYETIRLSLGLLGLIGVIWLGWAWWRKEPIAFSSVTVAYGVYLAAFAGAAALSLDPRRSLNALIFVVVYAVVWTLVSDLILKGWPPELFTRVLTVLGAGVILAAIWQSVSYESSWLAISGGASLLPPVILRPTAFLNHANVVAAVLNLIWPVVLVKALPSAAWPRRLVAGVWILLAWSVILLTSSRGAWLGAASGLIVTCGLWWWAGRQAAGQKMQPFRLKFSWKWLGTGVAILLLAFVGGWIALRLLQNPTHGIGLASRSGFWSTAWETFVEHPVIGQGPDTFATAYAQHSSVPPDTLYTHAHNKLLNLLAESGLLGALAGGALVIAVMWAGWRHWHAATMAERRFLAGIAGALAATSVHCFFDTMTRFPSVALLIATLTAILTTRPQPVDARRRAGWFRLALTGLFLALSGVGVWTQSAYQFYLQGTALANTGDWQAAAPELEAAVARDRGHALYNLVSGFAHGVLAEQGEVNALPVAIQRYKAGIALEPGYALNYANLATLYWQQGDTRLAVATMEKAARTAPQEATYWLNLGLYREKTGDVSGAREAFRQVLDLRPGWAEAYIWRATDLRRSVLEIWRAAHPQESELANANLPSEQALQRYNQALAANPQSASLYSGRAAALMELGRYQEAVRDARIAAFISDLEPGAAVESRWVLAQIAYRQGDLKNALALGEQTLDAFRRQSIGGPGTYSTDIYGWTVFYRLVLNDDMLPQLETIRFPDRQVAWLETVGKWYEEAGDVDSARRLYREALDAAPDTHFAQERLAVLGR